METKKNHKGLILIVIGVILLVVLTILGVKYYLDNYVNNPSEEPPIEEEIVSLTDAELNTYLSYIPYGDTNTQTVPYYNRNITIDEVDATLLVNMALNGNHEFVKCSDESTCLPQEIVSKHYVPYGNCHNDGTCDPKGYDFYPLDKVNTSLKKMYNIDFKDLKIEENTTFEYTGNEIMYYHNGFLSRQTTGSTKHIVHTIDKYEVNDNTLIIYDYPVTGADSYDYQDNYVYYEIRDFQNGLVIEYKNIDPENTAYSNAAHDQKIQSYIFQHKDDFTLFKYTFKKNNDNYYWYSSEVLSDERKENTFTEYELEEYLGYVPYKQYNNEGFPYVSEKSTINDVDKKVLISYAMNGAGELVYCEDANNCLTDIDEYNRGVIAYSNCYSTKNYCTPKGYYFYPLRKVDANLQKMYNINFDSIDIQEYDMWTDGLNHMYYHNGFLSWECCGSDFSLKEEVSRYEVVNDELLIYSNAYEDISMSPDIRNPITKENLSNIKEAPLYKHTFKKNATGYYWYSTEVVKE